MSDKTVTPDYRRIEKLIAAFHYEFAEGRGCCSTELLGELFDEAREHVLNGDDWAKDVESPTEAEFQRLHEQCVAFGEHMIRGLAAIGYVEKAEAFIECIALRRAECDAKFGAPREIPFTDEERDRLAKAWDTRPGAKETLALQARVEQSIVERATAEGEVQP